MEKITNSKFKKLDSLESIVGGLDPINTSVDENAYITTHYNSPITGAPGKDQWYLFVKNNRTEPGSHTDRNIPF